MLGSSHGSMQGTAVLYWDDAAHFGVVAAPGACWQEKFSPGSETTLIQQAEIRVHKAIPLPLHREG